MSEVTTTAPTVAPSGTLLEVEELRVGFQTESGLVQAVDSVSFSLRRGEVLAIVGESGSGKSVTAMTLMGLTRGPNASISGTAKLTGEDLISADNEQLQKIRGERVSMIFQDPMSSLNPVYRVGNQIAEMILAHRDVSKGEAQAQAVELMKAVGIPGAEERANNYPHEFSGGMRQRVMIAMALSLEPEVLIADEPTTALDVTIQAQILRLISKLNREREVATILITHDLGVVAEIADRVLVMYGGRVIEIGTLEQIFYDPQHPYTWGLLGSVTRLDRPHQKRLAQIEGQPPSLVNPPEGCHFRPRCKFAHEACKQVPALERRGGEPGHEDRCVLSPEKKPAAREQIVTLGGDR
jgi:peptide/nickel transport system ATP-binding protein